MSLPEADARRAMRLSILEGCVYALMVGFAETYFLADAVRLGASAVEQGLTVSLPLLTAGLGGILSLRLLGRLRSRRPLVVGAALAQAVVLAAIVACDLAGALGPVGLIAFACLHQVCGQAAGTAWSSWYGDLVPAEIRGRYFATRNRYVHLSSCAGLVVAGFVLQEMEPGAPGEVAPGAGGTGFAVVFGCAAAFRLVSALLLAASAEPRFRGLARQGQALRFLRTERGGMATRVLLLGGSLQFMVYLASPYFGPYMLEGLDFTYLELMAATVAVVLTKFFFLPAWGRAADQHGPRPVFALVAVLIALVPLPWFWATGIVWVAAAQALSGFSWAGYEVSYLSLMLSASYKRTRPHLFAAQSLVNGPAQRLGTLAGAFLLGLLDRDFRMLFLISAGARLAAAVVVPYALKAPPGSPPLRRRALLLRVIGFRPHGGLVHRPIDR